ncbi:MAG TPA: helix-turn-helix domain-containing protein [Acidimicrobiales bacterium]|nr:helix-turn-helix domain-containing protein [Acidimicrobiales bacterium]
MKRNHKRLTPEEVQALCADYQAGVEIGALVSRYGVTRTTVFEVVNRQNLPKRYPILDPEEVVRAAQMYEEGKSFAAVAEHFSVSAQTIRNVLLRAGVPLQGDRRQPGRRRSP